MKAKSKNNQLTLSTAWDTVEQTLKKNALAMPLGKEMTIRQIIGEEPWAPLDRTTRHRFGKYVRANLERFGLVFVGKAGTIAVYKKSAVAV